MKRERTRSTPPPQFSKMTLKQLRALLKKRGDARPKYVFSNVKENTDIYNYRYVFWLDLMGARNMMKLSLSRAARSVMKIHAVALKAMQQNDQLKINPVMDGVYGFVSQRVLLESCLREMMAGLANVFVQEKEPSSRFMVRAGVAFGPLIPGSDLAAGAPILVENASYLGSTAIGMAISQAFEAESCAPPFGVYIHESARAFSPRTEGSYPYRTNLWPWFRDNDALTWAVRRTLLEHFDWLKKNPVAAQYDAEALLRHKALEDEYFNLHGLPKEQEESN